MMIIVIIFLLSWLLAMKTIDAYSEQLDNLSIIMQVVFCYLIGVMYGVAAVLLIKWLVLAH